jgi:hypothetical protein
MLLLISESYSKAISFIRKNPRVLLPNIVLVIFGTLVKAWFPERTMTYQVIYAIGFVLLICFAEVFLISTVYVQDKVIHTLDSVWVALKKYYDNALIFFVACFVIYVFYYVIYEIVLLSFAIKINYIPDLLLSTFLLYWVFGLGLRSSIFHNQHYIIGGLFGSKYRWRHFPFYFLHFLTCLTVIIICDLLLPRFINWVYLLLSPVLYSLVSIAVTYAFISQNMKKHHVS